MEYKNLKLHQTAAMLFVLLSVVPINAEDLCSREGKSKMLDAKVTEAQIAIICPSTTELNQQNKDPKESNLANSPIGLHVQKVSTYGGMTYTDFTVRNNSGEFIKSLYIEVLVYDNDNRVGSKPLNFNSINIGETMITQQPIISSGRPWNKWKYTYKIL